MLKLTSNESLILGDATFFLDELKNVCKNGVMEEIFKGFGEGLYSADEGEERGDFEWVGVTVRERNECSLGFVIFDLTKILVGLGSYNSNLLASLGEIACEVLDVITRVKWCE